MEIKNIGKPLFKIRCKSESKVCKTRPLLEADFNGIVIAAVQSMSTKESVARCKWNY
jgi:hypothetical protein